MGRKNTYKPEVSYPDGLEAAILKTLPSLHGQRRSLAEFIKVLLKRPALRALGAISEEQVQAALDKMYNQRHFNPDSYSEKSLGSHRGVGTPVAVS